MATTLQEIAEAHCQQEPSFKTSIAYTRLTASEAIAQLKKRGLNFKRKKLLALLERVMSGDVSTIVVAHKDRLARFGFDWLE